MGVMEADSRSHYHHKRAGHDGQPHGAQRGPRRGVQQAAHGSMGVNLPGRKAAEAAEECDATPSVATAAFLPRQVHTHGGPPPRLRAGGAAFLYYLSSGETLFPPGEGLGSRGPNAAPARGEVPLRSTR